MRNLYSTLLIFLFVTLLSACGNQEEEKKNPRYQDFNHIEHWDDLNQFTEEKTIVYYYSPNCIICIQLEEPVTKLLKELEAHRTVFLANDGYIYDQGEPGFDIPPVPSLIIFENKEFKEIIKGSIPVIDYLENEVESVK